MFILRNISEGQQSNKVLGDFYTLIDRETNQKDFDKTMSIWNEGIDDSSIYSFLVFSSGAELYPLRHNQYNYIMTSDGKTFANITHK